MNYQFDTVFGQFFWLKNLYEVIKPLMLFSFLLSNVSGATQNKKQLLQMVGKDKELLEQSIKLSSLHIQFSSEGDDGGFDERDNLNFDTQIISSAGNKKERDVEGFLNENVVVGLRIMPPYTIVSIKLDSYDFANFWGIPYLDFHGNNDEMPLFRPLSVTYLDGSTQNIDQYKSKSLFIKSIGDKNESDIGNLDMVERFFLENISNLEETLMFNISRPIKAIQFHVELKMKKAETFVLNNKNKIAFTTHGLIKLDTIVGRDVYYSLPAAFSKKHTSVGLYNNGKVLRHKNTSTSTGIADDGITSYQKLITLYANIEHLIKTDTLKTEKDVELYLRTQISNNKEFKALRNERITRISKKFSGPVSNLSVTIFDTLEPIKTFKLTREFHYQDDDLEYIVATDFETKKTGIIDGEGKWVVVPQFDKYFRRVNKYFFRRQIDDEEDVFWFLPSKTIFKQVDYRIDDVEVYNQKYVKIEPSVNGPIGVVDASTGEVIIPMIHDWLKFEQNKWIGKVKNSGETKTYTEKGALKP